MSAARSGGTPECLSCLEKLEQSVKAAASTGKPVGDLLTFAEHLKKVPVLPVEDWPLPATSEFEQAWKAGSPSPYEYTFQISSIKDTVKDFHDWGMLCSVVLLNALWSSFYITGEAKYLDRILEVALPYGAFIDSLGVEYIGGSCLQCVWVHVCMCVYVCMSVYTCVYVRMCIGGRGIACLCPCVQVTLKKPSLTPS
jgi:hypothetical protein